MPGASWWIIALTPPEYLPTHPIQSTYSTTALPPACTVMQINEKSYLFISISRLLVDVDVYQSMSRPPHCWSAFLNIVTWKIVLRSRELWGPRLGHQLTTQMTKILKMSWSFHKQSQQWKRTTKFQKRNKPRKANLSWSDFNPELRLWL